MPLYEYRCGSCEHEFEELAKFNDPPPPCPKCGKGSERQLSPLKVGSKERVGSKARIHADKWAAEKRASAKKD